MRAWPILILLSTMTAAAAIMTASPEERVTQVESQSGELIVRLSRGSIVHFCADETTVTRILVYVGDRQLAADLRTCDLPRSIHTDGMRLIRDDLREDEHRSDALGLLFDVGSESDRAFGKRPRVQLSWVNGKLTDALISRQIASNHGFSSPLCE